MKKILSLLLTLALLLACLSSSLAEEKQGIFLKDMGLTFPAILDSLNGYAELYPHGVMHRNPYLAALEVMYWPIPRAQITEADHLTDEIRADIQSLGGTYCMLFVTDATGEEGLQILNLNDQFAASDLVELGKKDAYTWYGLFLKDALDDYLAAYDTASQEDAGKHPAANAELWKKDREVLFTALEADLKQLAYDTPVDPLAGVVGSVMRFESTDLDGNKVTSAELFAKNKVTMVNLWGTWCPNCINEMEELGQLHTRLQEKGCGIVGIEWERVPIDQIAEKARQTLADYGITYPNVLYPEGNELLDNAVTGYPTSFFVDSNGTVLNEPIVGAAVSLYEPTIEQLLAEISAEAPETAAEATAQPAQEAAEGTAKEAAAENATYRILTVDESGAPVQGTMVQFCSDTLCTLGVTNESGLATFEFPTGGAYTIHILKAPDGYAQDSTEYPVPTDSPELTITLKKAE